jgi:hypothetical protein
LALSSRPVVVVSLLLAFVSFLLLYLKTDTLNRTLHSKTLNRKKRARFLLPFLLRLNGRARALKNESDFDAAAAAAASAVDDDKNDAHCALFHRVESLRLDGAKTRGGD